MTQTNNETTQAHIFYARFGEEVPNNVSHMIVDDPDTEIPKFTFSFRDQLERIKLPEGLKMIGDHAFYMCRKLAEVIFPMTVETIDSYAFSGCHLLKEVKLPLSLKRINHGAFSGCKSLVIVNLPPSLELIDSKAFFRCTSLLVVHFPKSLQFIGNSAFAKCHSLIFAELPPTVEVYENAFYKCLTLELRQLQVDINSLTWEQKVQRSRQTITYLKVRFDRLPFLKIYIDTNTTLDQLQSILHANSNNIEHMLQQADDLGMTALHFLCLNPKATPEMLKIIASACPQAATVQAEMVSHVQYDIYGRRIVDETHEMVNPLKLWLKMKGISYKKTDFNEEGHITLNVALRKGLESHQVLSVMNIQSYAFPLQIWLTMNGISYDDTDFNEEGHMTIDAVLQKGLEWHDLLALMSIQPYDLGEQNQDTKLYPFMQAATIDGAHLESVYQLAMYDPKLLRY